MVEMIRTLKCQKWSKNKFEHVLEERKMIMAVNNNSGTPNKSDDIKSFDSSLSSTSSNIWVIDDSYGRRPYSLNWLTTMKFVPLAFVLSSLIIFILFQFNLNKMDFGNTENNGVFSKSMISESLAYKAEALVCSMPLAIGNCNKHVTRFYFDFRSRNCLQFVYSGCGGNSNRFLTKHHCQQRCLKDEEIMEHTSDSINTDIMDMQADFCLDKFDETRLQACGGEQWKERYFFDQSIQQCRMFWYDTSCDVERRQQYRINNVTLKRSRNVFRHWSTCRKACEMALKRRHKLYNSTLNNSTLKTLENKIGVVQAIFSHPQYSIHFHGPDKQVPYNESVGNSDPKSETIDSNENRTLKAGKLKAVLKEVPVGYQGAKSIYYKVKSGTKSSIYRKYFKTISEECLDQFDENLNKSCSLSARSQWVPHYYFNFELRKCQMYWSDGCVSEISRNNFEDLSVCKLMCEGELGILGEGRTCVDKFDEVMRNDCLNGRFVVRYFFNHEQKRCERFHYGGCQSSFSKNIFISYEDCLDNCETPTRLISKSCEQPLDPIYRHPCNGQAFSQYFYYDQQSRACRMFWYGNCRESKNENIFSTLETCQWLCERNRELIIPVSCLDKFDNEYRRACNHGTTWRKRWYFEHKSGQCREFWYDGCTSSNSQNIFITQTSCKNTCELPALLIHEKSNSTSSDNTLNITEEIKENSNCLEPLKFGNCSHALPSYYYNKWSKQCEPFAYSGCGGNGNRFLTLLQCQKSCSRYGHLNADETNCLLFLDVGHGDNDLNPNIKTQEVSCVQNAGFRFYYNQEYGKCARFWYLGCDGNENNFVSYGACEKICRKNVLERSLILAKKKKWWHKPSVSVCFGFGETNTVIDNCTISIENGSNSSINSSLLERWSFDTSTGNCVTKLENSCNQTIDEFFETQVECERTCKNLISPRSPECGYLPDWGPCNQLRYMWFYNVSSGVCAQFLYGGCGGNSNRFSNLELCQETCEPQIDDQMCLDKLDRGQWCDRMSNRYFYDKKLNQCRGFHYTGCGKSSNNFKELSDCEKQCVRHRAKSIAEMGPKKNTNGTKFKGDIQLLNKHEMLNESERFYIKPEGQWIDYRQCTGFRFNVSGIFTRLTSYICLMEEGGTCQVQTLWETHGDEKCRIVRPWLHGTHYYSWFFIVDRRPSWRRLDGPPIRRHGWYDKKAYNSKDRYRPQSAQETIATIIVLPVNDCHSIC